MGFNRLERNQGIQPGDERAFEMSPGCWDLDMGGDGYSAQKKIEITSGRDYVLDYQ